MTTRTADRVDEWESRPFTDGFEALHALADRSFSGSVTAGRATLYMLNGAVVGVIDGSIDDFEDASGTVYEAPTPALPLLAVMQERTDEVRAKYYSEETALSDADQKLSDGGFTGYIELSENVLSGDYYVVYHGGKSMSVAFVGESERLIADDEAFEKADEEVGIYEVRPVDIEPVEIPEPATDSDSDDTEAASPPASDDESEIGDSRESDVEPAAAGTERDASETEPDDSAGAPTETGRERESTTGSSAARDEPTQNEPVYDDSSHDVTARDDSSRDGTAQEATAHADGTASDRSVETDTASERPQSATERRSAAETDPAPQDGSEDDTRQPRSESDGRRSQGSDTGGRTEHRRESESDRTTRSEPADESRHRTETVEEDARRSRGTREPVTEGKPRHGSPDGDRGQRSDRPTGSDAVSEVAGREPEESDGTPELEHRTIPSVDPARTWTPDTGETHSTHDQQRSKPPAKSPSQQISESPSNSGTAGGQSRSDVGVELDEANAEIETLQRRIDDLEAERDELETTRDGLADERDELQSELERVRTERDELQTEVEDLRQQLAAVDDGGGEAGGQSAVAETTLSPAQAIDGTNLFVRYDSKGDATLESAHGGAADAEAVNANLNLEYHTGFDASDTAVDGQAFDDFLVQTIHYRFVDWVVRTLLYEIRDTGHQDALADLYDALPRIDRAELNGTVTVAVTEDGEQQRTQEQFDVVLRDRMGNPLVVTNLNDSRDAATDEMMTSLVTAAKRVGESSDHLAGGFLVTSSFFDPGALETASEAAGGGILSRDKRESFVRLSRKDGFHLCLVESRDGGFHLAVPEL